MEFSFDPAKSLANKHKLGIDFVEAQALWVDPHLVEAPAKTDDEPRFLVVGLIDGKHWAAVCLRREGRIRLISVRRARDREIERYEGR